jgi:hypothetical protein
LNIASLPPSNKRMQFQQWLEPIYKSVTLLVSHKCLRLIVEPPNYFGGFFIFTPTLS